MNASPTPRSPTDTPWRRRAAGLVMLALGGSSACVRQLPPAATPEAVAPRLAAGAPPDGDHGRLVTIWRDADTYRPGAANHFSL